MLTVAIAPNSSTHPRNAAHQRITVVNLTTPDFPPFGISFRNYRLREHVTNGNWRKTYSARLP